MSSCGEQEKAMIFSEENWRNCERKQKIRILKALVKEIAHDFGVKRTPHLIISKDTQILGAYRLAKNTLILSELMAIEGKQKRTILDKEQGLVIESRTINPNSNTDTIFTVCHEIEHAAQYQRVCGKIAWRENDDINGILVNMQQKTDGAIIPYIKGNADADNARELYQLQPVEYDANQSAMIEVRNLIEKYADYCSASDIEESTNKLQLIQNDLDKAMSVSKVYGSNNIVQDISHCLQNLFAGTKYHVPLELKQDVENACKASYRYIHSERYKQMDALLKKEINRELAKQEYER